MDGRQRRDLARRPVARRAAGFHPFVLAAWLLAALLCGVVLWLDAYFVIRAEGEAFGVPLRMQMVFGCFELSIEARTEPAEVVTGGEAWEDRVQTYAEAMAENRDEPGVYDNLRRLSRGGAGLFALACTAPLLGLLGLAWRRGSAAFRHLLLVLAALAPLGAFEYFGAAVDALYAETANAEGSVLLNVAWSLETTPATWWARVAWGGLAGAAAISWWRWPKPRNATPVDPEVFE